MKKFKNNEENEKGKWFAQIGSVSVWPVSAARP